MYNNGGVTINERTAQIIRFAGLAIPIVLACYGLLVKYGVAENSHYVSDTMFFIILTPWLLGALFQFFYASRSKADSCMRLVFYHILSAFYILFITGFATPFTSAWVLLFLASYAYFSNAGLRLSVIALIATAAIDMILHLGNSAAFFTDLLAMVAILVVGLTAISISRIQEVDGAEL
ncbi:MAG TPA: hypothetical protein VK502_00710, partial [Candidatus Saccharimonadales bacterium]|nr:hypothetical protein [Candidatus Saccharimonadales bacterium]